MHLFFFLPRFAQFSLSEMEMLCPGRGIPDCIIPWRWHPPGCSRRHASHGGERHWVKALARFCSSDRARVSCLFRAERVGGPGGIQATGRLATTSLRRTAGLPKANYTSIIDVKQLLTAYLPPQLRSTADTLFPGSLGCAMQGPGVQRGWERCQAQPRSSVQGT